MTDELLGFADLTKTTRPEEEHSAVWDCWWWCRRHEEAEHVSTPMYAVKCPECQKPVRGNIPFAPLSMKHECGAVWTVLSGEEQQCIRIGPFMSEREANRLGAGPFHAADYDFMLEPLGMEIEA
jgi:hypothetical protein